MCLSLSFVARSSARLPLLLGACALALSACDDGPVLTDVDGGPGDDAGPVLDAGVDAGGMDAGSIDAGPADAGTDAGPSCDELEPTAAADPTAGAWVEQYANPGVGGGSGFGAGVSAFAFGADGTVYVGGSFTKGGYTSVSNVAAWDGTTGWHALGDGLPGAVTALAVGDDGALYAVHRAEGEVRIGRWDGASWSTFAVADDTISELAVVDGNLFAVGAFTTIGGAAHANVAYHDGTSWQGYAGLAPDDSVTAISAASMNDVCIGGGFSTLGAVAAQNVACWDGSAWSARSLPPPPPPGPIGGFEVEWRISQLGRDPADGSLVAAGSFDLDDTNTLGSSIARWTGAEWALIGGGLMQFGPGDIATVAGFAFTPSGLYAGGNIGYANPSMDPPTEVDGAARWDGTRWHSMGTLDHRGPIGLPGRDPGPVGVVAGGPDGSVYFGGLLHRADSLAVGHVVRWDGSYWKGLRSDNERYDGVSGIVNALAQRGSCEIYVGGEFEYAGGVRANSVASYTLEDGYQALGDGLDGVVRELDVADDGRVYAVGDFIDPTGTSFRNVAVWDGTEWRGLGSGVGDPSLPDENARAIAAADGAVYVGGSFTWAGGERVTNLARWDGSAWSDLGAGMVGHENDDGNVAAPRVTSLVIDPASGDLVVGGSFSAIGGLTTNNIARWDGSAWHPFGEGLGGLEGTVLALTIWEGRVAVGRSFVSDDPLRFAVWNGSEWEPIGTEQPAPTLVSSIDGVGETFFAAGNAAGTGHVFVYDGSAWSELGMGVRDERPEAVLVSEGGVYFGGGFDRAGETSSAGIARWQYTP